MPRDNVTAFIGPTALNDLHRHFDDETCAMIIAAVGGDDVSSRIRVLTDDEVGSFPLVQMPGAAKTGYDVLKADQSIQTAPNTPAKANLKTVRSHAEQPQPYFE